MMKQALSQFPMPWLMAAAMGLFILSMAIIVFKTYRRSESAKYKKLAHLPFSEE